MPVRGVRGAITVQDNSRLAILAATEQMLTQMVTSNGIASADIASVWLTTTNDLTAEYPAVAARQMGWHYVPILCGHEMQVSHGLPFCIRALINWNTDQAQEQIEHVYLEGAASLRPDRAQSPQL